MNVLLTFFEWLFLITGIVVWAGLLFCLIFSIFSKSVWEEGYPHE